MKKLSLILLICFFSLTGCRSNKFEMPSVQGMIYDGNNEPVSDVEVLINDKKNAVSDIYGHFTLTGLELTKAYSLKAVKKGFEDVNFSFNYSSPSQVIYLRMYSASELLSSAEAMVEEKKYNEAEKFLDRAELSGGSYLGINYLRACIKYLTGDYDAALSLLNAIVNEGYVDSNIYLFIADVYENGFSDIENTKIYLQKALELSYDPAIQKRLLSK